MQDWKQAEIDFAAHWKQYGKKAWVHRFSDTAQAKALNGKDAIAPSQPSDFLVSHEGHTFLAEVKHSADPVSFPHSAIRQHQMNCAKMAVAAGGGYFFFLKSKFHGKWFRIPAEVVTKALAKSTKWSDITQYEWTP